MIRLEEEFVRLAIPMEDAVAFALGCSDLGYAAPSPAMRRIIGELAVDALQYAEQWRAATLLQSYIEEMWAFDE